MEIVLPTGESFQADRLSCEMSPRSSLIRLSVTSEVPVSFLNPGAEFRASWLNVENQCFHVISVSREYGMVQCSNGEMRTGISRFEIEGMATPDSGPPRFSLPSSWDSSPSEPDEPPGTEDRFLYIGIMMNEE